MDGENNGNPYFLMDDLGGNTPIFGNTHFFEVKRVIHVEENTQWKSGEDVFLCFFRIESMMNSKPCFYVVPDFSVTMFSQGPRHCFSVLICRFNKPTVDGRNPAPVDMVNIPLFTRFHACWVVQDFFHQPYVTVLTSTCHVSCRTTLFCGTGDQAIQLPIIPIPGIFARSW